MIRPPDVPQEPAGAAVVIPTVLRPGLLRAVRSAFGQDFPGRLQVLVGIDRAAGDRGMLDRLRTECPPHVSFAVFDPGYSTSVRHGGLYPNQYGGALRTILSYAANSRFVAYLDDDDWFAPMHLALLRQAIEGAAWAHSLRWLVDPATGWPICPDEWDSVGVDRGINRERFGGFAQPSTLMLDKLACHRVLPAWSEAMFADGGGEDRLVFEQLRGLPHGASAHATSFHLLGAESVRHPHHAGEFARRGLRWVGNPGLVAQLAAHLAEARAHLARGAAPEAERACRAALAIHAAHAGALRALGAALAGQGRMEEAALASAQAGLLEFGSEPSGDA